MNRRVPPLAALRVSAGSQPPPRDLARWLVGTLLGAGLLGFALAQGHDWRVGLGFAGGLGVVFGLLTLTARGLMAATRRFTPATLPFAVRQGVANLHRPNNRTLLLLLALSCAKREGNNGLSGPHARVAMRDGTMYSGTIASSSATLGLLV